MSEPRFLLNPRAEDIAAELLGPLAEAGARILVDAIKDEMEEAPARTGREYKIPGTQTTYTASAPGEPPAIREGIYSNGWTSTKAFRTQRGVAAAAVNNIATEAGDPIGLLLEDGTVRMAPRPHIREGMLRAEPQVDALANQARRGGA